MRIACLQHVPFEGPAAIGGWAALHGFPISIARLFAGEAVPALSAFDLLVVLGGPMSVHDDACFDWLRPEKRFIRHVMEEGKHVLGICLGAQLMANALGARVYPNPEREIGWFQVHRNAGSENKNPLTCLPETFTALHWHGETFDLPEGTTGLAHSDGCRHQAFALGQRVLGLQFHLESTPESVEGLIRNCPGDLAPGRFVQEAPAMLAARDCFHESNHGMATLLSQFVAGHTTNG